MKVIGYDSESLDTLKEAQGQVCNIRSDEEAAEVLQKMVSKADKLLEKKELEANKTYGIHSPLKKEVIEKYVVAVESMKSELEMRKDYVRFPQP
ncbi:hypothetical protein HOH87_01325 [bacterium]|nr:hypothetical protein [bacterium]